MKKRSPFIFWNQEESLKRIKMINPGDINIQESLKKMGLETQAPFLGICDVTEVVERNKVMRFLHENPVIRKEINRLNCLQSKMKLPTSEDSFLYFYSKVENPYWDEVKKLIVKIKATPELPLSLQKFVAQLESDLALEVKERAMADAISPLLNGVTFMEGTFSVSASLSKDGFFECDPYSDNVSGFEVFGYKLFNMSYAAEYEAELPGWLKKPFFRWTRFTSLCQSIANDRLKAKAKSSSVISAVTRGVKRDFSMGFNKLFSVIKAPDLFWLEDVKFDFYFTYNEDGLCIKLISASVASKENYFHWKFDDRITSLKPSLKKIIEKRQEEMKLTIAAALARTKTEPIFHAFKEMFNSEFKISSAGTDSDYKWYAIGHIYSGKEFCDLHDDLCDQRDFFFNTLGNLNFLNGILSQFENKAAALSLPLCIPVISTKHDGVFFKNLVPISLVGSNLPQIIPITLDRINGQMVGLTGRHGGGKTTIGKNVLQNVYFALSGLPVFAESFHTDVKTVLGAVTNDEGGGSTATVFVQKVTNLMKEICEVPPHESLVFIDEIGKGTQHGTGLELGKAILFTLSKGGNSVLFNTQTLELAEYAQESLNAVCYKANKQFEFTKGISGGELGELVKEIGLDKFLRN